MSETTVSHLAEEIGYPTEKLLEQLRAAGIAVSGAEASISDEQKQKLLDHLKGGPKITLGSKKLSLGKKSTGSTGAKPAVAVRKVRSVSAPDDSVKKPSSGSASADVQERQAALQAKLAEEQKAQEASDRARRKKEAELKAEEEARQAKKAEIEQANQPEEAAQSSPKKVDVSKDKAPASDAKDKASSSKPQLTPAEEEALLTAKRKKSTAPKGRKKDQESTTLTAMELYEQEQELLRAAEDTADKEREQRKQAQATKKINMPKNQHGFQKPTAPITHEVEIGESITVSDLAQKMSIKASEVIKSLMKLGTMVTINQSLDQETAVIVVEELGHTAIIVSENTVEEEIFSAEINTMAAKPRPPVVTIMGHVDHGKTSLLDYIRRAKVADGEAGGITQHIGAYQVQSDDGETISFLDTPGHAAFTAMRMRGAQATDIVVLVVAADDGVMPQTIEAIQHAKAAEVPLIVAINKIDKPESDIDRILTELSQHEVLTEEWGGEVLLAKVSAKTGEGIDDLLSQIVMQAEVLELKAPPEGSAKGVVIESKLDKGRGAVVSLLVQEGQLNQGDMVLCGVEFGRVRAMTDDTGKTIKSAGPSTPVEIIGLSGVPDAGEDFMVLANERKAREVAELRQAKAREAKLDSRSAVTLDNLFDQMAESSMASVNIVLKADVQGSVEAIKDALLKLSNDEVKVNLVSHAVGAIRETDVNLAAASDAIIIAFNVRADAAARRLIEQEEVDVRYYSVIYEAIEQVKQALEGLLAPEFQENIIGVAEVKDVFKSPKFGSIAGCLVSNGVVRKSNPIRVLRDSVVIYEGELESLRRFKDDVREVQSGTECGIGVKNYTDVRPGDEIEVYERVEIKRTLEG